MVPRESLLVKKSAQLEDLEAAPTGLAARDPFVLPLEAERECPLLARPQPLCEIGGKAANMGANGEKLELFLYQRHFG